VTGFGSLPIGHWSEKNMRKFLEAFAKSRNMDPLHPETWYITPREAIMQVPVCDFLINILVLIFNF
jgi:hypothetical protein